MELLSALRVCLPSDAILVGQDMAGYLEDWMGRERGGALCVALPRSREEVAAIVKACAAAGHGVIPQGGNTGLTGAGVPGVHEKPPVLLSLARMRTIRNLDPVNRTISVDAGCVLADVQQAALSADRLFPVSLGAEGSCQIGGIISTNAGGTNVLRYGSTRENVLGIEVVLPDGTIWDGMKGLMKNNAGYDLRQLFIGAEGSLGIVTGGVLRLHPLPKAYATMWLGLQSPDQALELLDRLQSTCGERLTTFELINATLLKSVLGCQPGLRAPEDNPWHVLVELADVSGQSALEALLFETVSAVLTEGEALAAFPAQNEAQRAEFWALRHGTAEANRRSGHVLTADVSVPVSMVPTFISEASRSIRAEFPQAEFVVVSHMGDGNIHFGTRFSTSEWQSLPDPAGTTVAIRRIVNDYAQTLNGSFSAEHGIGRKLAGELEERTAPAAFLLMKSIKAALDPDNIMNPGCLFR